MLCHLLLHWQYAPIRTQTGADTALGVGGMGGAALVQLMDGVAT